MPRANRVLRPSFRVVGTLFAAACLITDAFGFGHGRSSFVVTRANPIARKIQAPEKKGGKYETKSHGYERYLKSWVGGVPFSPVSLSMNSQFVKQAIDEIWFPVELLDREYDIWEEEDKAREKLQSRSINLAARLITNRLKQVAADESEVSDDTQERRLEPSTNRAYVMAKGKFMDLTCNYDGEKILEEMFDDDEASQEDDPVIYGAIASIQSLVMHGAQVGAKGEANRIKKIVSGIQKTYPEDDDDTSGHDFLHWDLASVQQLKEEAPRSAGVQILVALARKRAPLGAYDLLCEIGAWGPHEDLALLRSGFPLRFTDKETAAARAAADLKHDPDAILGLRKDLRYQKVFTIDSASTSEIDDGLSVEIVHDENGNKHERVWIHIADAERWSPRHSPVFQAAKNRGTTLYLPPGPITMFPSCVSSDRMSLRANQDISALSMGVIVDKDGSIIESSIVVTPSLIHVDYRLTYDDADEMLAEGIAYNEEWELGAMLDIASRRRQYRISNGSTEGIVPTQIPQHSISTYSDKSAPDGIGIKISIEASHNTGKNQSIVVEKTAAPSYEEPLSSSNTVVTELMILAGEAMGKWKLFLDKKNSTSAGSFIANDLQFPFRTQKHPDYNSRAREHKMMNDLLDYDIGHGYCHAWYSRRFFAPVQVSDQARPHFGLGLDCYVQWSSPIRRFADLQVHCAVKRFLRRQKLNELLEAGEPIPPEITSQDIGCALPETRLPEDGRNVDEDVIDHQEGVGPVRLARTLQRSSQRYWLLEYIRRIQEKNPQKSYEVLVLGCTNPERRQYAIYVYELGFEYKYVSPIGNLSPGIKLRLRVATVSPRSEQLTWTRLN